MAINELLVEATKAKIQEAISILNSANLSKGEILHIVERAGREVVEEITQDLWIEASKITEQDKE